MTIVLIIAIAVMAGCMAMLTFKVSDIEKVAKSASVESISATTVNGRLNTAINTYNTRFSSVDAKQADADAQIESIIARLTDISFSLGELEKEQAIDRRNLNDIRRRYVLYKPKDISDEDFKNRVNAVLTNGAGVSWAKEMRCTDDE